MASIKKYSKVKFTLRKELVFILAAIIVLVVATILLNLPTKEEKFADKWSNAGGNITVDTNIFTETSFDDLGSVLSDKGENEITFVFLGTPSNEESITYFNTLVSLADLYGVGNIYLIDSEFMVDRDRTKDQEFDDKLTGYEDDYKTDEDTEMVLDSLNNFWVFKGDVLVESTNDYELNDSINWSVALIQMFSYAKAE